jgi:hypothetical protein
MWLRARPEEYTAYATAALEQGRTAIADALKWIEENRIQREEQAANYPPLTLTLPPMHNLQSMYSAQRPTRR